jgi:hypothetical protein
MMLLSLVRLLTAVVALTYSVAFGQQAWWTLYPPVSAEMHAASREPHTIMAAGIIGMYTTVLISMLLAYGLMPRSRLGVSALSWCFILMAMSLLLNRWALIFSIPYQSRLVQLTALAWPFGLALPALILAIFIRYPIIKHALQPQADGHRDV